MRHQCRFPGCSAILPQSGYCAKHARIERERVRSNHRRYDTTTRATNPELAEAKRIRSSKRWQRVRALKLSINPLCEDPFGTHAKSNATVAAREVHHVKPLALRPDLAFRLDNLQSLCHACHDRIEQDARRPRQPGEP